MILELTNIRVTIKDFNETQKNSVRDPYGTSGNPNVTFLTEKGLYKLLSIVRNNHISEKFQEWVYKVIKEIRLTGQYKLEKEISELREQIVDEIQDKSNKLIRAYNNDKV